MRLRLRTACSEFTSDKIKQKLHPGVHRSIYFYLLLTDQDSALVLVTVAGVEVRVGRLDALAFLRVSFATVTTRKVRTGVARVGRAEFAASGADGAGI